MAHAELRGVVALDGPSGTGKSTVARKLAAELRAAYLDTGAMYRAATLAVLRADVPLADASKVGGASRAMRLEVGTDPLDPTVVLDGEDVATAIREADVTGAVSEVSAVAEVREVLVAEQRRLIERALESPGGIVVEGRDIGTAVVPDARLKVYLTADAQARAQRRRGQDAAEGRAGDLERTIADVRRRDALDSGRKVAPLRMAADAVVLDTTRLDVAGVLEQLTKLVESRAMLVERDGTAR